MGDGLLADQKHIHGAEVEVVEEGQSRKAVVGRMLAGIELLGAMSAHIHARGGSLPSTYHDRLSLVLDDVTRPPDLVAPSEAEEHELIRRVYWLFRRGRGHGRGFPF